MGARTRGVCVLFCSTGLPPAELLPLLERKQLEVVVAAAPSEAMAEILLRAGVRRTNAAAPATPLPIILLLIEPDETPVAAMLARATQKYAPIAAIWRFDASRPSRLSAWRDEPARGTEAPPPARPGHGAPPAPASPPPEPVFTFVPHSPPGQRIIEARAVPRAEARPGGPPKLRLVESQDAAGFETRGPGVAAAPDGAPQHSPATTPAGLESGPDPRAGEQPAASVLSDEEIRVLLGDADAGANGAGLHHGSGR